MKNDKNITSRDLTKEEKKRYDNVKSSLLYELDRQGLTSDYHKEQVNLYMQFWTMIQLFMTDIEENGVKELYQNGENQWGYKKNDSVSEILKVNNNMNNILSTLGIRGVDIEDRDTAKSLTDKVRKLG